MIREKLFRIREKIGKLIIPYETTPSNRSIDKNKFYELLLDNFIRKDIPFQNIEELSNNVPRKIVNYLSIDFDEPIYYGGYSVLSQYAGIHDFRFPPRNVGIQHGYTFEMLEWEKAKLKRRNLVWSKKIAELYKKLDNKSEVYAIGAPFFYAQPLITKEEIDKEKWRLGRNLLAFPMHSSICTDTDFDPETFIKVLQEEKKNFDSVRVCVYWKDVVRGNHQVYLDAGFECVCSGHIYDQNFLRRQKSLFEIADATISNGIGSHVGYSIYMKKPHKLIKDSYTYTGGDGEELTNMMTKPNYLEFESTFLDNKDYLITNEQILEVDKYWGISDIKSSLEMKNLLTQLYIK